jgi:hypothetical protein
MIIVDMIIVKDADSYPDRYTNIKFKSVKFEHMSLIMDYAFKSGYDVIIKRCDHEDEGEE